MNNLTEFEKGMVYSQLDEAEGMIGNLISSNCLTTALTSKLTEAALLIDEVKQNFKKVD